MYQDGNIFSKLVLGSTGSKKVSAESEVKVPRVGVEDKILGVSSSWPLIPKSNPKYGILGSDKFTFPSMSDWQSVQCKRQGRRQNWVPVRMVGAPKEGLGLRG